jgi:hypothetical protein
LRIAEHPHDGVRGGDAAPHFVVGSGRDVGRDRFGCGSHAPQAMIEGLAEMRFHPLVGLLRHVAEQIRPLREVAGVQMLRDVLGNTR